MNELIQVTTDAQGASVVRSARELHSFLEVKSNFTTWFKRRVKEFGFIDGRDFSPLSENPESEVYSKNGINPSGGRPELDYALTLNMAKELSMVERNEKGKQARAYFIQCEERLRQLAEQLAPTPQLSTEQVLLQLVSQSNQLLANQQEVISQLRADVDAIKAGHRPAPSLPRHRPGKQLGLPGIPPPRPMGLRQVINQRISEYCSRYEATTQETYNYLYKRLHDVYGINVYRLSRSIGESLLDALERYGHLDRLHSLVMAELAYSEE